MKVIDLARLLLDQAPHHKATAALDGWACEIVDVRAVGHGEVEVVLDPPEGYRLLPDEPTDAMLDACGHMGLSSAQMRVLWKTMVIAHDKENDE